MCDLMEYLNRIVGSSLRPITFSGDVNNVMNKWLVKAQDADQYEANNTEPFLKPEGRVLLKHEYEFLSQEELEKNWRFFISDEADPYTYQWCEIQRNFELDKDKYVYAVATVYCQEEHETMIFCASMTPISIWINGELVYLSNYDALVKESMFVYNFKKGINIVLIEKPYFLRHSSFRINPDDFLLTLKPYDFCANRKENYFFDMGWFTKLRKTYTILMNNVLYDASDKVEALVLPRYFGAGKKKEKVVISAYDDHKQLLVSVTTETSTRVVLDIDPTYLGIVKISATIIGKEYIILDNYLLKGDLKEFAHQCIEQAKTRKDCNEDILYSLNELVSIPNTKLGTMQNYYYMMNTYVYHLIFEKLYEFTQYLHTPDRETMVKPFDIYKYIAPVFYSTNIDDNSIPTYAVIPRNFDWNKKNSVVFHFEHGYASEYPVIREFHRFQDFEDTLIIDLCGRGGWNKDFINECQILEIIEDVVKTYNIDRNKIYTIGSCTGAMKSFGLGIKNPGLFAGIFGINGPIRTNVINPDFEQLTNLNTVLINEMFCVEDNLFNCSTMLYTFSHVKNVKLWPVTQYTHEDFNDCLNSRIVVEELLKLQKTNYPKELDFTMTEPIYNHCHWVVVDYTVELSQKAKVKAVLLDDETIQITTRNISKLSLLLNKEEMHLQSKITINVDGQQLYIQLGDYTRVILYLGQEGLSADQIELSEEEFLNQFYAITVDENSMGIKQLYYKKCRIIYSSNFKKTRDVNIKKLIRLVNIPLRERVKNYEYKKYSENEIEKSLLGECNFIYLSDLHDASELRQQVFETADCSIDEESFRYHDITFTGDTFAIIKCKNPFNDRKCSMLVAYNSDSVLQELLRLWGTFDDNSMFYGDAIIYNHDQYYSYRDN